MTNEEILALFEKLWGNSEVKTDAEHQKQMCKTFFLAGIARGQQIVLRNIMDTARKRALF